MQFYRMQHIHQFKSCPSCKEVVFKEQGCNEMDCVKCKNTFCWQCETVYKKGEAHFLESGGKCVMDDEILCPACNKKTIYSVKHAYQNCQHCSVTLCWQCKQRVKNGDGHVGNTCPDQQEKMVALGIGKEYKDFLCQLCSSPDAWVQEKNCQHRFCDECYQKMVKADSSESRAIHCVVCLHDNWGIKLSGFCYGAYGITLDDTEYRECENCKNRFVFEGKVICPDCLQGFSAGDQAQANEQVSNCEGCGRRLQERGEGVFCTHCINLFEGRSSNGNQFCRTCHRQFWSEGDDTCQRCLDEDGWPDYY